MPTYQLQIKQVVDYPRCRIYRQFVRFLMEDRSIRVSGGSGLFYFTVLCSYANFRTSYRRIDGISYTVYPGEWVCTLKELSQWFRTRFQCQALAVLERLQKQNLISFQALGRGNVVRYKICDWAQHNTVLEYNAPCQKDTGFFFLPVSVATDLISSDRCSEMDIVLDLWISAIYNDNQVQGSDLGPVVYGSSGSMKTRSFCMNRILQAVIRGESLIISDPKSELYEKSSEYLREQGYCVKVFNLVLPENSDSWNCLSEVEGQELMAQLFVDVIIKNTNSTGKGDHFWDSCEMNLLKALVLYVDQSYAKENRNIGEVYRLLTLNGESDLDSLFDVLPPTHPAKAPYSLFKQASDTVRSGVIIGLGSRLQVFQSELIKKITTRDEIDLELPGQERCAYFLVTSDQDSTFDFLASLFLSFCFIKLVRYADKNCEGGKLPVPVHILGEELTACGTIPDLSRRLSVIRSRNISMSCVFQNLAGLQNRYPLNLWQEILGNCDAQLFLGCTDSLTAEFISERTGLASVSVSSKSKQLGTWRISNYTPEYRETSGVGKRPVLTPDEVLRLPITQALVIIRGQKALKVEKMDYSKHPESSKLRDCKASAHIPEWRKLEEQAQPKPAAAPSPPPKPQGTAPKKPVKRKPKAAGTPAGAKQAAPAPSAEAPDGIITTDKDSILS